MPIVFQDHDGFKALELLAIPPEKIKALLAANVVVHIGPVAMKLVQGGEVLASVPVKQSFIKLLLEGKIGSSTAATLKAMTSKAVNDVLAGLSGSSETKPDVLAQPFKTWGAKQKPPAMPHPVPVSNVGDEITAEQMLTLEPVPLSTAVRLYQPVRGTTHSSRYFLVAAASDLRVAARYKNNTLSVRIVGKLDDYKARIVGLGLDVVTGKDYVSIHLKVEDVVIAAKVLGAIIGGLMADLTTLPPNIMRIAHKGN
jgi:hypothetical protein